MRGQGFKKYPAYKDAELPWLRKVPKHWKVTRLKNLLREVDRRSETGVETSRALSRDRGLIPQSEMTNRPPRAETLEGYKICLPGEIVMNRMQAWNGMFGLSVQEGLVSPDYTVLKPITNLELEYYVRLFKTPHMIDMFSLASRGLGTGSFRLYTPEFYNICVPFPTLDEQRSIVRFVNQKLVQIDQFICYKRRLTQLLNEQKKAIIHRAVTKGIDRDMPIKPSGIAWLGEIPCHWQVRKVKYLAEILRGKFTHRPRNDPRLYDGNYPFIQTGDVASADEYIVRYSQTLNEESLAVSKLFSKGTLIMTTAANIADVDIVKFDACFPDSIIGFIPKNFIQLDYLYNLLLAMRQEFFSIAPENTQLNLNVERVVSSIAVFPPLVQEQTEILNYIEAESSKIAEAIAQAEKEIELIQEYRTTLISNAVTGKIDVRDTLEVGVPVVAGGV